VPIGIPAVNDQDGDKIKEIEFTLMMTSVTLLRTMAAVSCVWRVGQIYAAQLIWALVKRRETLRLKKYL
jgi:hypothetical protein